MQFNSIIGQQEIIQHLLKMAKSSRISHAQLFLGNAGFGGLPLALAFSQFLLCENPSESDSCGACPSCKKCEINQHPDLHFSFPTVLSIADKSNLVLPQWREMIANSPYFDLNQWTLEMDEKGRKPVIGTVESQEIMKKLALKSFEGGYKIMIIWMAEEMNATCANKLLKILEEPPEKTLFLLVCENAEHLLPTIISRTQLIKLAAISDEDLAQALTTKHAVSPELTKSIIALCSGDYVEAKRLIQQGNVSSFNEDKFIECMRISYKKEVNSMLNWAEDLSAVGRENQKVFLKYSLHMFRQSILMNYTGDQLTQLSETEASFLKNFARFITGNNVTELMNSFSDAHYQVERNANSKILFTDLCFKVMRLIHLA